jgi:hypothetical protein
MTTFSLTTRSGPSIKPISITNIRVDGSVDEIHESVFKNLQTSLNS